MGTTTYRFHLFDCPKCKTEDKQLCADHELFERKCKECGGDLEPRLKAPTGECATYIPFKSGWYEHIAKDPIYIKDKYALRAACKKHNMGSNYLDDM